MRKIILFSDFFNPLALRLHFALIVAFRFIIIFFKRNKKTEKVRLTYSNSHIFKSGYIYIDYYFKNALWVEILEVKSPIIKRRVFYNLENIHVEKFTIKVQGFFQKKQFEFIVKTGNNLINNSFKTQLSEKKINKVILQNIKPDKKKPVLKNSKIELKNRRIKMNYSPYKQSEIL